MTCLFNINRPLCKRRVVSPFPWVRVTYSSISRYHLLDHFDLTQLLVRTLSDKKNCYLSLDERSLAIAQSRGNNRNADWTAPATSLHHFYNGKVVVFKLENDKIFWKLILTFIKLSTFTAEMCFLQFKFIINAKTVRYAKKGCRHQGLNLRPSDLLEMYGSTYPTALSWFFYLIKTMPGGSSVITTKTIKNHKKIVKNKRTPSIYSN